MPNEPAGEQSAISREWNAQATVRRWMDLGDERLAEMAMHAAEARDSRCLWELTMSYIVLHSPQGTEVSWSTARSYELGIRTLVEAWADRSVLTPTRDAGPLYARLLEARGLSTATISVRLAAVRQLYRALRWSGATHADPFDRVRPPVDRTAPWDRRAPYSSSEVKALLEAAGSVDQVIVLLGAHAGLRASEMVSLRWDDVNGLDAKMLIRRGKGGKSRSVSASGSLLRALDVLARDEPFVLPFRSYSRLAKRMYRLCDKAGVPRKGLHALRHTAGTEVMRQLGDLEAVARHLGHSNLETARVYAKWSDERLKCALAEW